MTRREQVRELTLKLLGCTVPTALLAGAMFAVGGKPAAVATLVFGGLAAIAAGLVAMLVFFAYVRGA